ncbi:SNF5-domain-containing protein [Russula ochroleuca]|uniref:SNF5-domain-containing protein n=1 Tax=Russula ochroleuca TaxID=152965 RepID=A0A9P5T9D9_9AGAM|nr:SNF5-domain-containing protein [Russula ochroleuca]
MRVTLVPPSDIKPLTEEEVAEVKGWMARDKEYEAAYRSMKERAAEELRVSRAENSDMWWEVSDGKKLRTKFGVTYPGQRLRDNRKRGRREGFRLPGKVDPEEAKREEILVPIRLEFDVEHHRMREAFVWNLNDPIITPEIFAQSLVDDYALAPSYLSVIIKSIQDQLSDFQAHTTDLVLDDDAELLLRGRLDERERAWWDKWRKELPTIVKRPKEALVTGRKRRKLEASVKVRNPDAPATVADIEVDEKEQQEEMRILIRLDIGIGSMKLDDQFEWDIENPGASPEQFAEVYALELGLGSEFRTAIAHSIREQVHTYQKSLFLVGHPSDGTPVQDDDLRMSFLSPVTSVARPMDQVQAFTPILNYLSDSEMERNEKEREKEMNKRKKRATRGRRGVALPDREPIKTLRTPAIGFPDVDPAVLALAQAAAAPTSRRAAAAAASLTIANMVASENGTAVITPTLPMAMPSVPTPSAPKEKKTKGLFKPPSYPQTVLHPRAHVSAPTMSTAADASKLPPPLENDPPAPMPVPPPQDNRLPRVISAKRAKELEREAKEKEFADGQHPNLINGVWHCSNCGCPEDIAIGRRKGPLGDKSQCGTCGKFWHRHRRPRPVMYNPDPEYHLGLRTETDKSKIYPKKKGGAAARAANTPVVDQDEPTPATAPEPETPSKLEPVVEIPRRAPSGAGRRHADAERAVSPVSSGSSSASESPLIQKMKLNGTGHSKSDSNTPMPPHTADDVSSAPPGPSDRPTSPVHAAEVARYVYIAETYLLSQDLPPHSLIDAHASMNAKYPDDRFDIWPRMAPSGEQEWRVKCLDCPGKLYIPGDGMSNFEVHLKNRNHRARVAERLGTTRTRSSHDQR